ncbi:adenosine deaminase [Mesorhizobium xinjiangense]|uniref:adenosine deaminase n=1 Tax=Mesorhizobium xinjiangense TaxID=2678685 RepID=UPI0012EEC8FB|nr:adenosine deaminase [Mesorhizobium xinjiangense]
MPKAELHCHIEGAADTELVMQQAAIYGADMSPFIRDGAFVWHDFTSFLAAYDASASLFRTEEDYARLAEHYLASLAGQGAIYSEIFISPDHAMRSGLSPRAYLGGLAEGVRRAKAASGIEARMIVIGVRHFGAEAVEAAARFAADCDEPLVTGFGMAGEERHGNPRDYAHAFDIAREAGLGITVHAGELAGWESVAAALDHLRPARIGHGVRAVENPDLVRRIAGEGIVLECCPCSNVALQIFDGFENHPLPQLMVADCKVTLSSDDPPYFRTSIRREYEEARRHFGMDDTALGDITRTAIEAAFIDEKTRQALLARLSR